jgi:hypothetical protein
VTWSKFHTRTHSFGVTCETRLYLALSAWRMWTDTHILYVRKENYSNCVENIMCYRTTSSRPDDQTSGIFEFLEWGTRNIYETTDSSHGATSPSGPGPRHYRGFTITLRHATPDRTALDEWSARRRDLYLTTRNNHKRQTSMFPAGFETAIPASEQQKTHALDREPLGSAIIGINPI